MISGLIQVEEFSRKRSCFMIVIHAEEKASEVDLSTSDEWEIKTITSALKLYLR